MSGSTKKAFALDEAHGFKAASFVGSEIAELRSNGEKPPRTAKLVVALDWSWSPAHFRTATYFLSAHPRRNLWTLWEKGSDYDTGKPTYARVAWGAPCPGYSAAFASKQLLAETWRTEISLGGLLDVQDFLSPAVDQEGLLTKSDIEAIGNSISKEFDGE